MAVPPIHCQERDFALLASEQLKPIAGLDELCNWIEDRGLKRAAITNAPRPNVELMIPQLGLADFFEIVIIGSESVGLAVRNPEKLLSEAVATFVIKDFTDSKLWTALEDLEKKTEAMEVTA
ncbi:Hypothetical predicted protein [Olea europaea subsp. europaea]|uniref:Uncharacterized protein n=1 Tax=Olea europaea subsp. europaea TaxID=158383 RepID=A0A8S0UXI4_OLEEU|nr:Hypothetical predicted protein [Olea europaea subsp. europaea]